MKGVRGIIEKKLGGPCKIARMLGFKEHQKVSYWLNSVTVKIPYHFAICISYLTGIRIEKIAPYAKEANMIISQFLLKKSLPQFNSQKMEELTIEATSDLGKRIIITDEGVVISGSTEFKKAVKNKKELKQVVVLPVNEIIRGSVNLNILDFSIVEKYLIATHLRKILKQNFVFRNETVSKILADILQVKFEELTNFDYLTKHASENIISYVDLRIISVSEAYSIVKESEAEYGAETINRQQYAEYCPQSSIKRIQDMILHTEFGCLI